MRFTQHVVVLTALCSFPSKVLPVLEDWDFTLGGFLRKRFYGWD